jgi:hypothetical protein
MQSLQNRLAGRCCSSAHRAQVLPALPVRGASHRAHRLYRDINARSNACRAVSDDGNQPQLQDSTAAEVVQQPEHLQSAPLLPAPVQRILTRRSVKYEEDLHKPLGLVLFGAYVLGSASSVAGEDAARQRAATPACRTELCVTECSCVGGLRHVVMFSVI